MYEGNIVLDHEFTFHAEDFAARVIRSTDARRREEAIIGHQTTIKQTTIVGQQP
jgi:hypothetical protein